MQIVIVKFQFKACCYIGFQKNSRKGLSSRPSTKKADTHLPGLALNHCKIPGQSCLLGTEPITFTPEPNPAPPGSCLLTSVYCLHFRHHHAALRGWEEDFSYILRPMFH